MTGLTKALGISSSSILIIGSVGKSGWPLELIGSSAIGSNDDWRGLTGGIRFFSTSRLENPLFVVGSSESNSKI